MIDKRIDMSQRMNALFSSYNNPTRFTNKFFRQLGRIKHKDHLRIIIHNKKLDHAKNNR